MFGMDEWIARLSDGASIAIVLLVAVLLGVRHATDPDHLAAVSTLVASGRERATAAAAHLGLWWGIGHAISLAAFGVPILVAERYLPDPVQRGSETAVAALIVFLAIRLLVRWRHGAFARSDEVGAEHHHPVRSPHAAFGIGSGARDGRERRCRCPAPRSDPVTRAGDPGAPGARPLHSGLDDDRDDGVRRGDGSTTDGQGRCGRRPGARHSQPRLRPLVRRRRLEPRALSVLGITARMDSPAAGRDTRGMTAAGIVRERDLRMLSAAIGLSALGDGVALVALGLQAKNMSGEGMGSGFAIAGMFICLWAPVVLLSGHVGLLVDRVETRGLLVTVSALQAGVAVALAIAGSLWLLLLLAALLGAGIAVAQASEFALVPAVAGATELQRANALVETGRALGFTVGPLCGSLLVATGGTAAAMLVDAASFVVVGLAGASLAVRRRPGSRAADEHRRARDGIGFLFADRLVALMVTVVFVSLLFMSASIPADLVYVEDVLGIENIGIGIVFSAWTLGMLVGSNLVARRVALGGLAAAVMIGVTVQGLGKFVAPFWLVFGFMVAAYFVGGVGHGLKNVSSRTLSTCGSRRSGTGGPSPPGTALGTPRSSARSRWRARRGPDRRPSDAVARRRAFGARRRRRARRARGVAGTRAGAGAGVGTIGSP